MKKLTRKMFSKITALLVAFAMISSTFCMDVKAETYAMANAVQINLGANNTYTWSEDNYYSSCYYKFTTTANGIVTITTSKVDNMDLSFELINQNEVYVYSSTTETFDATADAYIFSIGLPAGTYYMEVYRIADNLNVETTINYSVNFTAANNIELEANESEAEATELKKGVSYTGFTGTSHSEADCYKFYAETAGTAKIYFPEAAALKAEEDRSIFFYYNNYDTPETDDMLLINWDYNATTGYFEFPVVAGWNYFKFNNYDGAPVKYTIRYGEGQVLTNPSVYMNSKDRNAAKFTMNVTKNSLADIEYKWVALKKSDNTTTVIKDWTVGASTVSFEPDSFGEYIVTGYARYKDEPSLEVSASSEAFEFNPYIKGKCQMPYWGEGGGYLIGVESYENPNQSYYYEMLILDCTLLAKGEDAWVYTTGLYKVDEGNAGWCIWQPQYGYYWTLFRVYDADKNMIDQACYGFANAY